MKSVFIGGHFNNKKIINKLLVVLFSIFLNEANSLVSFTYPSAVTLPNNNYFIIEQNGIYIYDKYFSSIVNSYIFSNEEKINYLSDLSEVIIRYQNNYLICLIKSKIFLFDNTGNLLTKTSKAIVDSSYWHPTLAPTFVKNNYYYFIVGYFIPSYKLKLINYRIHLSNHAFEKVDDNVDDDFESYWYSNYDFRNKGLSCEYMLDDYAYEYYFLICFFIIENGSNDELAESFYEITESKVEWTGSYRMAYIQTNDIKNGIQVKSVTSKNLRSALVSVLFSTNSIKYYKFRFEYGSLDKFGEFSETKSTNLNCRTSLYSMKLNYLINNNNIVLSCINSESTVQAIMLTDGLTEISTKNQFSFCQSIYAHTVLYSAPLAEYYVISDVQCGEYIRSFEPLEGELAEIIETTQLIQITEAKIVTEAITEKLTEKVTEKATEKITEKMTEKITEKLTEKVTDKITEKITDKITEKLTEKLTDKITEKITDKITEKITDKITEKITNKMADKITYEITDKIERENEKEKENEEEELENEKIKEEKYEKEIEREVENETENKVEKELENNKKTITLTELSTPLISFFDCSNMIKCSSCNEESYNSNLCITCNNRLGYYYLNKNPNSINNNKYIDCVNEETKPLNFYFNKKNQDYELCYSTCATCDSYGNFETNNCTSCDEDIFTKYREEENSTNCVVKCKYYITDSNIRQCVKECPDDYNLFVEEINKCIDDCKKDIEYKYRYNGHCYKKCPNNTLDDNDFICKDIQLNKCFLTINDINYLNENFTIDKAESLTIKYAKEFCYTDNHVSQYKDINNIYRLTIYINSECISDLNLQIPEIDFKNCYQRVKNHYHINEKDNIIIAVIDKKIEGINLRKIISHGMFDLNSGKYLDPNEMCKDEIIIFAENVENKLIASGIKLEVYKDMAKEGIDLFNLSSPFYNDICFQYNSSKDIALKDRVLVYFPNISLCDENCELKGINMTTLEAICECLYSDTQNKVALKENALVKSSFGDIEELLNSINIYVLKCVKLLIKPHNIKKYYGGYIILMLFFIQIISIIVYYSKSLYHINKYVFGVINKYLNYIAENENISNKIDLKKRSISNSKGKNAPPKAKNKEHKNKKEKSENRKSVNVFKKRNKSINHHLNFYFNNEKDNNKNKDHAPQIETINNKNNTSKEVVYFKNRNINNNNVNDFFSSSRGDFSQVSSKFMLQVKDDLDINIEEYLEIDLEKMDYYEAIKKDKRKFCTILCENLRSNQTIINTFCMDEPLKPKPIKLILLTLQIDLYFFVNGLFFDEEYISKIYHLEEDNFKTILERFIDNLLYATLVGVIVGYIIELFFVEEQKIKNILRMEKDNTLILKYETIKIMKNIKIRYILFIIISLIITLFTVVHISCFNIVYKHTKMEWLIFSFIIIALIQFFSIIVCFLQSILRIISFKAKSEKIYKLSLLLSEFL